MSTDLLTVLAELQAARTATCNQSINHSCIFVVQVIKSLQDPLEVENNLLGISDNVRERGLEQKCFQTLMKGRQMGQTPRCLVDHIVMQAVPYGGSGNWECPAADGRQFHRR